jgi:hypothetical protein
MTDQRQSTRDRWTPPARTLEQADPDWNGPASSTQDSTARDSTDADRPADDGVVYQSATYDSVVDEPDVDEPVADGTADEPEADGRTTEHPVSDGDGLDAVGGSVPAGHAGLDHVDPEHAVGVASVPDAEPALDPEADTIDHGAVDSAGVAAQDGVRTDGPAYGIEGNSADALAAVQEPQAAEEHDGVTAVPDKDQPIDVDDVRDDVAGGQTSIVPAPMDDAASPDVTDRSELLPGDLPEEPGLTLFDAKTTQRFRDRWQELQLRFVDDPPAAEGQAIALVDEVVAALRDAVDRQRSALQNSQSGQGVGTHSGDTERMRVAVRRYRDFLDRLLGL